MESVSSNIAGDTGPIASKVMMESVSNVASDMRPTASEVRMVVISEVQK